MMSPSMVRSEPANPILDNENIRALVVKAIPTNRYVYCGEVSKTLKKALGVYVSPDRVRKIAFTDANVKRLWTQDGWKITRAKNLSDYLQTP